MADYETSIIETQPTNSDDGPGRNWLRLAGTILVAILVGLLIIFAARWAYRLVFGTNDQPADTAIEQPAEEGAPAPGAGNQGQQTPGTTAQPGSGAGTTPGGKAGQNPATGDKLPNSGPAHVVALFASSSLAGAGIHYIVSRRRN